MSSAISALIKLDAHRLPTYYSPEAKERATRLSALAEKSVDFVKGFYKEDVQNTLLVLNEADYYKRMPNGFYGLIHGIDNYLWYPMCEEDNPVYHDMLPYYENAPQDLVKRLGEIETESDTHFLSACLTLWDVLLVHEMVHNYNRVNGVRIKLRWFDELFADYITYAFLKRSEKTHKRELDGFKVLLKVMYWGGKNIVTHTSLDDFEELYTGVGAANYCWYHGWFSIGVFELFEKYGEEFIKKIISLYQSESGFDSSSERLVSRLDLELEGLLDWYNEWIKQEA